MSRPALDPIPRAARIALLAAVLAPAACGPSATDAPASPAQTPASTAASGSTAGAGALPAPSTALRFVDGTAASGVAYLHQPSRSAEKHMPEIMGSGLAVLDVDRDGDPDLLFAGGGSVVGEAPPGSGPRLFVNDGAGRFADASAAWGLPDAATAYGMGVAVGDVDGDGWTDAFLTSWGGGDALLRNTGDRFEDVTAAAGVGSRASDWSSSAGFLDADSDGDLDLYVARYVAFDVESAVRCWHGDIPIYCTPQLYDGQPDRLLLGRGDGTFEDASEASGIASVAAKGLALALGDVDLDGNVDAYLANDLSPNLLWINDGAGRFADRAALAGVAVSADGRAMAGMGADLGDIDGDGRLDLVDANFQREPVNVHLQGDGLLFREVADAIGVGGPSRARLKWGADLFDADNDGDEDLLVAAGHIYDNVEVVEEPGMTMDQPNLLFENRGGTFADVSAAAGDALADSQVSRGLVTADLDGDGDLDYVVSQNGGSAQVAFNETQPIGGWLGLWLEGRAANRSAIGARVAARVGGRDVVREVRGSASYLSVPDLRVHVGLGDATGAEAVTVRWPGGDVQELGALEGGRWYRVAQGQAPEPFVPGETVIAP